MSLPPIAPFPEAVWRGHIVPHEWEACLDAWILLAEAYLSLERTEFISISSRDDSLHVFLISYMSGTALTNEAASSVEIIKLKRLRKLCFLLTSRLLVLDYPPDPLMKWEFLSDFSKVYGKMHSSRLVASLWTGSHETLQNSLADTKINLTKELDRGIKSEQVELERKLKRLNHLLYCSPDTATFFMNGSDFLDGLTSCYKVANRLLRKAVISTTYLCITGLTKGPNPKISLLTDQLYSLIMAAETNKTEHSQMDGSLITELVSVTPILQQFLHLDEKRNQGFGRMESVVSALKEFQKPGGHKRKTLTSKKGGKGKDVAINAHQHIYDTSKDEHLHRISLISQVQDLFPNLGAQFVMKLLDEYGDDMEQTILGLLEGRLPMHLREGARSDAINNILSPNLETHTIPSMIPARRSVFDDDEFDQLVVDPSHLHFGRRNPEDTADDILKDRSTAPNKAAILSALAAFDSDDDERDDTYDVEDVGGTVDAATPSNNPGEVNPETYDGNDETLFQAYKITRSVFDRDTKTRRGPLRMALKEQTGMTDEAIEGWALMLARDPRRLRLLEAKFSSFSGAQTELTPSSWRADARESSIEHPDGARRGSRETLRARSGRGRGNVAGPAGDKVTEVARQRKEASKGSRANHNRRDQRAKKLARGSFQN